MQVPSSDLIRFGPYEIRCSTREFFKHGVRLKLPPQAFEVLRLLLERQGELVTRQQFQQVLWPADTFVDFDQGLNNAIKRIREVLNDSAEIPRYIETLPRLGYRFVGTVELQPADRVGKSANGDGLHSTPSAVTIATKEIARSEKDITPTAVRPRRISRFIIAGLAAAVALAVLAWFFRPSYAPPRIKGVLQLTSDDIPKWGPLATDGLRVYFTEYLTGQQTVAAVPVSGGQSVPLKLPFKQASVYNISADKADLLVAESSQIIEEAPLWRVPVIGGTPRRLGNIVAHDAAWSPDGTKLAYTIEGGLYLADADGSNPRALVASRNVPDEWAWRPTWSRDGRRIRFEYYEMEIHRSQLYEVNADGSKPHPLLATSPDLPFQASGEWTPDGKYYIFCAWNEITSSIPWPASNLWAIREGTDLWRRPTPSPVNLTSGPIHYFLHTTSLDGKTIFALSSLKHGELMRYDARTSTTSLYASGLSAEGVSYSRDGAWVAYVKYPQGELWRSRADGTEPLQLSPRLLFAVTPTWSPDGKQIAFAGRRAGEKFYPYVVSADGGQPRRIKEIGESIDPAWLPDGNSLIFEDEEHTSGMIRILNQKTGVISPVSGSRSLLSPRISPDGRWIAAISFDLQKILVFDRRAQASKQAWKELTRAKTFLWPQFSADSRYLYFSRMDPDPAIMRVSLDGRDGHALEQVLSLKGLRMTGVSPGWFSLTPHGDVLWLRDTGGGTEIYALSWDAP